MDTKTCSSSDNPNLRHKSTEAGLSIPVQILEEVFDCLNLTNTEKLICRLVCKDWNNAISPGLTETSRYVLACRNSNKIVLDSIVQWTSIRISDYGSSALTDTFRNRITRLQLDLSGFPDHSTTWKHLLIEFPNVTTLHLNIDDDKAEQEESKQKPISLTKNEENQFERILHKLENLSVTFPFNNYSTLNNIMCPISWILWHKAESLTKLVIRENWSPQPESSPGNDYSFPLFIDRIITSSHVLRHLELDFCSRETRIRLIPELIPELCKIGSLKLESLLLHHEPISEYVERDFALLHQFVKTQASSGVLKNIVLPWSSNALLCGELVRSLPRDIESVGNVRKEHITQEFPFQFKKLKWLSVGGYMEEEIFNEECSSVQELQVNSRKYGFSFNNQGEGSFRYVMSDKFPNLTTLKVIGDGGSSFVDQDLQNIIDELKELRNLHVESCGITDVGVTGADEDDTRDLLITGRLYVFTLPLSTRKQDELNSRYLTPLSSLENLEKLVLIGTKITDVGIVLGFQFGSKLKQLTLGSESDKVSNLGLHCLGANCHGLEAFQGSFKSIKISEAGIEDLKEQLPLINSTQQFKVVNVKPS